jgi:predicted XRE-type DNA-binding protein
MRNSRPISWIKAARKDFDEFPDDVQGDMLSALTIAAEGGMTIGGGFTMKDEFELIRGSGNVFRDVGRPHSELEQARAVLAAEIIRTLDVRDLSTREAERLTGVSHSEFSRIRNARLERFTLDRMIAILEKLDEDVEVSIAFRPRLGTEQGILHAV